MGYDLVSASLIASEGVYDVSVSERRDPPLPRDLTPEKISFGIGVLLLGVFVAVWVLHRT